jgi:CRISPR/Cas system CMR-associated protein Cmr1 (group 7 of RAMP superfamily)
MMASTSSLLMPVVNVWRGVIGNRIISPYFIEVNVNSERHSVFLLNILPPLLQDTLLRNLMWM